MIIYNLFPLLAGKFTDWEPHIRRAAQMGFGWVFVNPIQRPGGSGSIYSISDYFDFNPLLIDSQCKDDAVGQIRKTIRVAKDLGLKMMIDLVINHCAADSDLIRLHPQWFERETDGSISHPFAMEGQKKVVWTDLAKFDHRHPKDPEGMLRYFMRMIRFLLDLGFTGFRCDAAYQIPGNLWRKIIAETKSICPDAVFVAETLGCTPDMTKQTAASGFDYIFNSVKWWDFSSQWLMQQYMLTREVAPSIGFPESHDTERLAEELEGNLDGLKQRYLFSAVFSGGVMLPVGFEYGFRKRLHVVKTRPGDWEETDIDLTGFIAEVNQMKQSHQLLLEDGPAEILPHDNPAVLFMWKACTQTREEMLLVLNLDLGNRRQFKVKNLHEWVQAGGPLTDISPTHRLDYIPAPFHYDLQPGQGLVLVTSRDQVPED